MWIVVVLIMSTPEKGTNCGSGFDSSIWQVHGTNHRFVLFRRQWDDLCKKRVRILGILLDSWQRCQSVYLIGWNILWKTHINLTPLSSLVSDLILWGGEKAPYSGQLSSAIKDTGQVLFYSPSDGWSCQTHRPVKDAPRRYYRTGPGERISKTGCGFALEESELIPSSWKSLHSWYLL